MSFADVILPLPLDGLFTYAVPQKMEGRVRRGMRVLVPFGRSKSYVGIVARLHDKKPEGYAVKPIALMMDDRPVLLESQLKLWEWIADYYMSPIGDVMKAALPSGLKAEGGYSAKTDSPAENVNIAVRVSPKNRRLRSLHAHITRMMLPASMTQLGEIPNA